MPLRSQDCLQTDKRSLGTKAMLGEMRDLVEKRKAQEATGADVSHLGPPELVYGYNDRCGTSLIR